MKIKVEWRHIHSGKRCKCEECPVALAISEATGRNARVYFSKAFIFSGGVIPDYIYFPAGVADWIYDYDRMKKVYPFEFELPWNK